MRPRLDEPAGLEALAALVEIAIGRDIEAGPRPWYGDFLTEAESEQLEKQYRRPDGKLNSAAHEAHVQRLALPRMTAAEKATLLAIDAAYMALPDSPFRHTHDGEEWAETRHVLLIVATLEKRIADLEQRASQEDERHITIIHWGDDDESRPQTLTWDNQRWTQAEGESRDDFMARVKADLPPTGNHLLFAE
jgi:hypothetical protein